MTQVQASLVRLLEQQEEAIAAAWTARLGDAALLAGHKLLPGSVNPVRHLLHNARQVIATGEVAAADLDRLSLYDPARPLTEWRINLCQAIEVLLTGEVVVRRWMRTGLDATDRDLLEAGELINRAFHQLLRLYSTRYCDHCHERLVAAGTREPAT